MKMGNIYDAAMRSAYRVGFKVKKYSPEILIVAGVVGVVAGAVMACKATIKANDILEDAKEQLDTIHETTELAQESTEIAERYSEEDSKKDITIVYVQTVAKLAKVYAPAVIIGGLSIASILCSNNILRKRNIALSSAYAIVSQTFDKYRGRVVDKYGAEVDHEMRYGIKAEEVTTTVVNEETGREKKVKKKAYSADIYETSDYARMFDARSQYWDPSPARSNFALKAQERLANDRLKLKGWLTLNEVYEMLGFSPTKAGMVVGWIYSPDNIDGDNYIDFGLENTSNPAVASFIQGLTNTVPLDFNVDGEIYSHVAA